MSVGSASSHSEGGDNDRAGQAWGGAELGVKAKECLGSGGGWEDGQRDLPHSGPARGGGGDGEEGKKTRFRKQGPDAPPSCPASPHSPPPRAGQREEGRKKEEHAKEGARRRRGKRFPQPRIKDGGEGF